jgi:UDP-N-acetylmuramate dehydrogenase
MGEQRTAQIVPVMDEPLARHTSWRVGGPARYYLEVCDSALLQQALAWAAERELPLFVLGAGTNVLVRDNGFAGLVIRYTARQWQIGAEHGDTALLEVAAGAPMAGTVRRLAGLGWGGLEWAEGLPGTIGGAVFGNAGCYGGDIAAVLERAGILCDGQVEQWPVERLAYGYRTSRLKQPARAAGKQPAIVLDATLRLRRADPQELATTMAQIAQERKGKTPWGSSCGSVFKNPPGESAGRLIDAGGLKGRRVGQAEISRRHANYIVNLGGAGSDDILALIELAQQTVARRFGLDLELEVQVL